MQAVLKMITNVSLGKEDAVFNNMSVIHGTTFLEALNRDPIACGRVVVWACRALGQHHKQLSQLITEGNANKNLRPK